MTQQEKQAALADLDEVHSCVILILFSFRDCLQGVILAV